jgi:hypothetical protein
MLKKKIVQFFVIVDAEPTDIVHFCFFHNLIGFKSAYIIKMLEKFAFIKSNNFNMHLCNIFHANGLAYSKAALLSLVFLLWNVKKVNSLFFNNCGC